MKRMLLAACWLLFISSLAIAGTKYSVSHRGGVDWTISEGFGGTFTTNTADQALTTVLSMGVIGRITFVAGYYDFDNFVTIDNPEIEIVLEPGAILVPSHTGAIGLMRFTGNDCSLVGRGKVWNKDWVSNQIAVEFLNVRRALVDGPVWQAGADNNFISPLVSPASEVGGTLIGSTTAAPMVMLKFTTCPMKTVRNSTFYPGQATIMLYCKDGAGVVIENNHFTGGGGEGIGGIEQPTLRFGYQLVLIEGDEWGRVTGNRFFAVGDDLPSGVQALTAVNELDFVLRLVRPFTPAGSEGGHFILANNHVEFIATHKALQFWGVLSLNIENNLFGFLQNTPDATGDAMLLFTGDTGLPTGNPCAGVNVVGNDIHNTTALNSEASAIFVQRADIVLIGNNTFGSFVSNNVISLNPAGVGSCSIIDNFFHRATVSATHVPIDFTAGPWGGDLFVGGNRAHNFTGLFTDVSALTNTAVGASLSVFGTTNFDEVISGTNITFTSIAGSPSSKPRINVTAVTVSSSDTVDIEGQSTSTTEYAKIIADTPATFDATPAAGDWLLLTGTTGNNKAVRVLRATSSLIELEEGFDLTDSANDAGVTITTMPARKFYPGDRLYITGGDVLANTGIRQVSAIDTAVGLFLDMTTDIDFTTDATSTASVSVSAYCRQNISAGVTQPLTTNGQTQ